jgi:CBS domain-containing protein
MQTVNQLLRAKGGQIFSVLPTDSVLHAIKIMATHHIGALLVMNQASLADIMTASPTTVSPQDTVRHCMQLMTEGRFRHLPVVESGRVVGILSIGDLVKAVIEEQQDQIEQLERYIAG